MVKKAIFRIKRSWSNNLTKSMTIVKKTPTAETRLPRVYRAGHPQAHCGTREEGAGRGREPETSHDQKAPVEGQGYLETGTDVGRQLKTRTSKALGQIHIDPNAGVRAQTR